MASWIFITSAFSCTLVLQEETPYSKPNRQKAKSQASNELDSMLVSLQSDMTRQGVDTSTKVCLIYDVLGESVRTEGAVRAFVGCLNACLSCLLALPCLRLCAQGLAYSFSSAGCVCRV